jgi:hypothetical protein
MRVELAGKVGVARGGGVTPDRELRTPPGDCGAVERSTKERQFFKSNVQPAAVESPISRAAVQRGTLILLYSIVSYYK